MRPRVGWRPLHDGSHSGARTGQEVPPGHRSAFRRVLGTNTPAPSFLPPPSSLLLAAAIYGDEKRSKVQEKAQASSRVAPSPSPPPYFFPKDVTMEDIHRYLGDARRLGGGRRTSFVGGSRRTAVGEQFPHPEEGEVVSLMDFHLRFANLGSNCST
ncbi:hypothetical protein PAHAL_9G310300 [Panicum hallii]|jgi:hypothetical protein|uniref:Uncharacterized protein n=1 Tax=Panicum hallii TaxID=206008 RepID=A0A2T8I360_9POAL|nr:hypothetical protein PAHAL_9G310300 [Panicum hallii]